MKEKVSGYFLSEWPQGLTFFFLLREFLTARI